MSKMSELDAAVSELKRCGDALIAVSEALRELYSGEEPAEAVIAQESTYTLVDVRKALTAKSKAGFTDQVKDLLKRHGAERLSDIAETEYAAMMKEAEAIA